MQRLLSPSTRVPASLIAVAVLVTASACTSSTSPARPAAVAETTTTTAATTTTTTVATTTTTAPPTTTTAAPAPVGLVRGSRGPEVLALEEALAARRYDVGRVDGVFDAVTGHAVMAFQKVHGLRRTGRATQDVLDLLPTVGPPGPMLPGGGADRVEIDLKRQILQLYKGGDLVRVVSVSTGNNKRYCVKGDCAIAVTPGGSFRVTRKINGLRVSRLGKLYDPVYFNGGIAIHGSPSVPAYPASHGCVRVPMATSQFMHDAMPIGMPVYVLGGRRAAVPFDEKAPGEESESSTTTTTSTTSSTTTTSTTTTTLAPTTTTTTTAPPPTTTTTNPPTPTTP